MVRSRPVGSVQVAVPSGARWRRQPGRCLMRWCRRHRVSRLRAAVRPVGQGRTWSRSQNRAAMEQPGKRQRPSRARDQCGELVAGSVGVGGEVVVGVEAGPGEWVAGHERRAGSLRCARAWRVVGLWAGGRAASRGGRAAARTGGRPCTSTRSSSCCQPPATGSVVAVAVGRRRRPTACGGRRSPGWRDAVGWSAAGRARAVAGRVEVVDAARSPAAPR